MDLPDDYFLDTDDEMLSFLEKENEETIKEIIQANSKNKQPYFYSIYCLLAPLVASYY